MKSATEKKSSRSGLARADSRSPSSRSYAKRLLLPRPDPQPLSLHYLRHTRPGRISLKSPCPRPTLDLASQAISHDSTLTFRPEVQLHKTRLLLHKQV